MAKKDKIQDLDKEERGGGKILTVLIIFCCCSMQRRQTTYNKILPLMIGEINVY